MGEMSTSSAASSSQDETDTAPSLKDSEIGVSRRPIQHSIVGHTVSNSSMSTLDRSQYQHISQSGTRRITVQFSNMKIVVPWKETLHTTVRQLADAALIRYKRAKGLPKEDESIRVLRLECVSDGGVLDMEDELEDVFDMAFDQILAITDEPMYATPHRFQPPSQQNHYAQPIPMTQSRFKEVASPEGLRSAVLSESPGTSKSRVTLSPEVEKRLIEGEERKQKYEKNSRLQRGSDRKSRINDAFMDARDRLTEKMEKLEVDTSKMSKKEVVRGPLMPGSVEGTTIVTILAQEELKGADEREIATECGVGMEVNAVYEDISASTSESGTMTAVQVMKIDKNGRVALDGRIRVGDNIVEIDGKPVSQISIFRARRILNECENREIRFTIGRPIESFAEDDAKPIFSALQQANTQYIGHTTIVELIKSSNGFGFTVTGRETAKGDRLFYIGTVRPNGVALGHLKSGDRLLEVNGESTSTMTQSQIVDKLKEAMVGSRVKFLVSRVSTASQKDSSENKENKENKENEKADKAAGPIRFELVIPLNDTGSAGLGVSLKARVSVKKDGQRHDCGVFIKNVMHGGAAFKDGRLQINDRIVGIENIDLEGMSNSKASEELTRKLKSIGPNSSNVRLVIIRDSESNLKCGPVSRDSSRITIDASSPAPSAFTTSTDAAASPHARMPSSSSSSSSAMLAHSRQSSAASSVAALQHVRRTGRESIVSTSTRMDDSEIVAGSLDPFDREAPGRKSLSEKRGMGAAADPQHIKLFQEIKHQRQNSAPPTSRASEKRSKSSQPRSHSQRMSRNAYKTSDDIPEPPVQQLSTDEGLFHRRSQSMESINRPVGSVLRGVAPAKPGVQFVGGVGVDHPFPPGSPILRPKDDMRSRDKSKRKSVGNAMKNFFGFGSKSRDSSPEKSPVQLKSAAARNDEVYSRSHENPTACMEFGDAPRYQHMPPIGYESYADSELYDRYSAHRYMPPPPRDHPAPSYVNYGLSASGAYGRQPAIGGSVSSASLRRAVFEHEDQAGDYHAYGRPAAAGDYYHVFNSWFAYNGGGGIGAAPIIKQSYGSPVRIAAAQSIERGDSFAAGEPRKGSSSGRGTPKSPEKHVDGRRLGGGSTRMFIPRHGGGLSAAAFGLESAGSSSPNEFKRREAAYRFPQF